MDISFSCMASFASSYQGAGNGRRGSHLTRDQAAQQPGADPAVWSAIGAAGPLAAQPLASPIFDFYLTNPIARASETMAECSRLFVQPSKLAAE